VDLANRDRAELSTPPLVMNPKLAEAARLKLDDMIKNGYFDHHSPDGISPWHWFKEAGYDFIYAGENLAVNFADSEDVQRAWMASPLHKKNILNVNFTEIGIATGKGVYNGRESVFVVQMFGKPVPKPVLPPQVTPEATPDNPEEIIVVSETPQAVVFGDTFAAVDTNVEGEMQAAEENQKQERETNSEELVGASPTPQPTADQLPIQP